MNDKFEHKAEEYTGTAKRKAGEVTDDPDLQAEGRLDEGKSKAKQAKDKAADTAEDLKEGAQEKARQAFDRDR
jgi:uncharacterized protein YjbJ (UPF0337 family)